jgi:hypothetical protein
VLKVSPFSGWEELDSGFRGNARGTALIAASPVFWLESVAWIAFGISWYVKGEAIFKDDR